MHIFKNKKGFSIVEIMAVIVILGILIGISVPVVFRYIDKSSQQSYDTMARSAKEGVETYLMDTPSRSGKIRIKDLIDDGYLEKTVDPEDSSEFCDGSVEYNLVKGASGEQLDEYNYKVNLCCTEYEKAYSFPSGEMSELDPPDFCEILRATGKIPGDTGGSDPDEPEANPYAPTCNIKLEGTKYNGAYITTVVVKLETSGTVNRKGLSTTEGTANDISSAVQSEDGVDITYYGVVRNAYGENTCSATFTVDKTPPECPVITTNVPSETWTNGKVIFNFDFDDDADNYDWFTNNSSDEWKPSHGNNPVSVTSKEISEQGQRRVKLKVYDKYGNSQECTNEDKYYYIDTGAPTCRLAYTGTEGVDGWYDSYGDVTLLITSGSTSDITSEIKKQGSSTVLGSETYAITSDLAETTFVGTVKNAAGVSGNCQLKIKVDKNAPAIGNVQERITGSGQRQITAKITDSASKISGYTVTTTADIPTDFEIVDSTNSYDLAYNIPFTAATYYIWAIDNAGNVSSGYQMNVDNVVFNINYDLDEGTVPDPGALVTTATGGQTFELSQTPTRAGWDFVGWKVEGSGSTFDNPTIKVGYSNVKVTALWQTNFSNYITYLHDSNASGNSLYAIDVAGGEVTGDGYDTRDIRYVGSNPNNYVSLGGELWRIVGKMLIDGTSKVKLVRKDILTTSAWDTSTKNMSFGVNEWSASSLKSYLNTTYYNNNSSKFNRVVSSTWNTGAIVNGDISIVESPAPEVVPCDPDDPDCEEVEVEELDVVHYSGTAGVYYRYIMQNGVRHKITYNSNVGMSAGDSYMNERSPHSLGNQCVLTDGKCSDTVTRTATTNAYVGLISASDYAYASTDTNCRNNIRNSGGSCKNNNWLHVNGTDYWTLTPAAWYSTNSGVMKVKSNGFIELSTANENKGVRPVVYLDFETLISTGVGTTSDPYVLK